MLLQVADQFDKNPATADPYKATVTTKSSYNDLDDDLQDAGAHPDEAQSWASKFCYLNGIPQSEVRATGATTITAITAIELCLSQ